MKNQIISRKILFSIVLLGFALIFLFLSYQSLLMEAGRFLAPEENGTADVVIIEGTELVKENAIKIGLRLLYSERTNHIVVVVQQNSIEEQTFALPNYTLLLTKNLEHLGLKKDQFLVIEVPKNHPITLTEARFVLSNLSKIGVRSAILLSKGFHTRRSFWTYKKVGIALGIRVIPYPYFVNYRYENWWNQFEGVGEFFVEFLKFFYYILCGYIPIKSLLVT